MSPRVLKDRIRAVARYALLRASGRCARCPAPARPERSMCLPCALRVAAKQTVRNRAKAKQAKAMEESNG